MIKVFVQKTMAQAVVDTPLTSGSKGLTVEFVFSEDWNGLEKTAVFETSSFYKETEQLTGETIEVPEDVMAWANETLYVGVYGTSQNGATVIPTVYADCGKIQKGANDSEGGRPLIPAQSDILQNQIDSLGDRVAWLEETGGGGGGAGILLDPTLTQPGKAADAKAVGDALAKKQEAGNYLTDHNTFVGDANTSSAAFYEAFSARKPCFLLRSDAGGGMVMWVAHDCTSRVARFYNVTPDGTVRYATLEGLVFSYESAAGGSGNVFVGDANTTVAEFYEADQAGKVCFMKRPQGGSGIVTWVAYNCSTSGAWFYHVNSTGMVEYGNLASDGSWSYTSASIELDTTLTQSGKAADAKAVGDALANISGGVTASVEPAEDDIPKVFLTGTLPVTKSEVKMGFRYISKTEDVAGYVEIKCQGNTSMNFPKKNFTVKMFADEALSEKMKVDFKGWGKQSKHVYKANWIDITHARNVVSARLWADVVKSRANYAELPELLRTSPNQGAVDGFPIKVYANGVYQGRYTLNIPKDAWMANMDDELDSHCILCGEGYTSGCFREASTGQWTDEVHDSMPTAISTRWLEVINFVMNSTDDEFKANLGNYFDVQSLIDYHLFGLVSCGLDAYGKNQLYMTYDGQKWIASMYDMDATWGLWWNGSSFVAADYDRAEYQDFKDGEGNLLYIRLEELFSEELQARWAELRSGALSVDSIVNRFERFTDIASAELVAEDYASTTADGKFTSIPSVSANTIQQIRAFAVARHAWCDTYVAGLVNAPCTGITLSASELTFTGAGSQTIVAAVEPENTTDAVVWSVDDNGIATVFDGVVTAVANGSCVVTATCGAHSATCAVTVSGISEIDYALDALSGVTWTDGYTYNHNAAGALKEAAGQHITSKFAMQNCTHTYVPASGATWPTIHIWDENGAYAGRVQGTGSTFGEVTPNPKYQYALEVYKADGSVTDTTLLPVDNRDKAVETMHFEFAKLSFTRSSNGYFEADASSVLSEHGVSWSELSNGIASANYLIVPNGMNASKVTGDPVCRFAYYNNVPLLIVFAKETAIDAFNAWIAESNPVLTIN